MAFAGSSSGVIRSTGKVLPISFQAEHSVSAFARSSVAPSTSSDFDVIFGSCGGSAQDTQANMHWDHTAGAFYRSYARRAAGNNYYQAQLSADPPLNQWFNIIVNFDGFVSRVYIDGVLGATSASGPTGNANTVYATILGSVSSGGGLDSGSQFIPGQVAEVGYWDVSLDADERASLVKGFRPPLVRPSKLQAYFPAIRQITELRQGSASVITGSLVVSDHPPVFG